MVRFGNADLRIRARALFLADHERDDAREIGLERQQLQVQQQIQVILEDRWNALRLIDGGQLQVPLLLGLLNAALDVADGVRVLVDLGLIFRPERSLEARQLLDDRIENAAVPAEKRFSRRAIRAAPVAEQLLEHGARVE